MFALVERHVGDFAEAGAVVVQRANMAPVHIVGAVVKVVSTEGGQPYEYGVDLVLGVNECVQRCVVGLGYGDPRVCFGYMTAPPVDLDIKSNLIRNFLRTCVIPVSHGCCTEEIGTAVSVWNLWGMYCAVLQRKKGAHWAPCIGLNL